MVVPIRSVSAACAGEAALVQEHLSFEEFYEANHQRLFVALCLITGNRHEAEEVMQEAFVRILERWDRMDDVENPSAFLHRVALNVFRNRYRRMNLAVRRRFAVAPATDDLAAVEDRDALVRALRRLTPQQRQAIVLTTLLDYSSEEAGLMLGIRPSTVRVLTTRARAAMKERAGELR
jgi:RNA polymerase sigma-70 factor (ECF subfamily)